MQESSYLSLADGRSLAYARTPGAGPGVIFLTGFKSDMTGAKALALEAHCRARGQAFLRFDYTGHGASSGAFEEGCIGDWLRDARDAFDALTHGPQVVVGSSMGGWIALLLAMARPERVQGLVGIASAPDFTEELIWQNLNEEGRQQLQQQGVFYAPSCYGEEPYPITRALIEEARGHLLFTAPSPFQGEGWGEGNIPVHCPVRLLHGMQDADVPWQVSARLAEQLASHDVRLTLVKGSGHRMSGPLDLQLLCRAVAEIA